MRKGDREPKYDCEFLKYGYVNGHQTNKVTCSALKAVYCRREECSFYKPKGEKK